MINGGSINDASVNGFVAADEEAYQLWLRDPSPACGHIVYLGYNGDSAVYPNWVNRQLLLTDFPLPGYHPVIDSIPSFKRELGEGFTGMLAAAPGDLVLNATAGDIDQWIGLSFDGQRCLVTQGDPAWAIAGSPDRFRTVFEAVAEIVTSATEDKITIRLRAKEYIHNTPVQTNLIPDSAGVNANSNQPVPLLFGYAFNISPVCIDPANQVYQVNDAAAVGVLRDGGTDFSTTPTTISAVNTTTETLSTATAHGFVLDTRVQFTGFTPTPPAPLAFLTDYWVIAAGLTATDFRLSLTRGGAAINITGTTTGASLSGRHWTDDAANGQIYLDSKPAGQLTGDYETFNTYSGTPDTHGSALLRILGTVNLDPKTVAFIALGPSAQTPQIGLYISERRNRLDVANEIMAGIASWYGYSRSGLLRFGRIESSYTAHDLAITADKMCAPLTIDHMIPPEKRHRLGYRKNFTDQTGKLNAGVTEELRQVYSNPFSVTEPVLGADEGPNNEEFHALAAIPDVKPTLMNFIEGGSAVAEAARLDALYYGWGAVYRFDVRQIGAEIDMGDVLLVTYPRYGFQSGVRVPVVSIEDHPSEQSSTIKVFAALAAYAPGQI